MIITREFYNNWRQVLPKSVKTWLKKSPIYLKYKSNSINIYHCCVQKTGSQWLKSILSNSKTYRYSGLRPYSYQQKLPGGCDSRKIIHRSFDEPFPINTIVTPLYIDFRNFYAIPKPEKYKAFFVLRDPRDLAVSWYFSIKYSHYPMGKVLQMRELLNSMSFSQGLLYAINYLYEQGQYAALESWVNFSKTDPNVLILRFEDLININNFEIFKTLFNHCDIHIPDNILYTLIQNHSFEQLSGRQPGEEYKYSNYRKGIAGDWKNHFDSNITDRFKNITGDLIVTLGYEQSINW